MNLSDAIAAYRAARTARGISPGTLRNDKQVLELLLADVGNIQTRNLRPQHIDVFWTKRTTWGPGTKNRARNTLNTFFIWCQNRGHIARDMELLGGERALRVPPRDRVLIPQSEFETMLDSIEDPRKRVGIAIGLYLFTRISETEGLRWQDINFDNSTIEVFRSKTKTLDTLPLCEELEAELKRWRLAYAAQVGEQVRPSWFVVPAMQSRRGQAEKGTRGFVGTGEVVYIPTKRPRLGNMVTDVLTKAGYYKPFEGGHTLRRSGATALYDQLSSVGHDRAIRICQAMLGHANISTTEVYLRLDLDRKVRNDLLAGKPMFPQTQGADVLPITGLGVVSGQADTGAL